MKIFLLLLSMVFLCCLEPTFSQNNLAIVNKIQGFYIFTDSQPLAEYEVVDYVSTEGNEDIDIANTGRQYEPVRDYLIKEATKKSYNADGLIFNLVNGGTDKAVIIKFKEFSPNKNQAKVNQYRGVYVFVDSEPIKKTFYLGTVESILTFSTAHYTVIRDKLLKRCKSKMPFAKGLVIRLVSGGVDTADAVRFEN